jgi:hypothetical protein
VAAVLYATPEQYAAYVDPEPVPDNVAGLLRDASLMLDSRVLRYALYDVDTSGAPTDPLVAAAFRDAVCAQVEWWGEIGDSTGAMGVGWGAVSAGSVSMSRSVTAVSGEDSLARQFAPKVVDHLTAPNLHCKLRLGWVR